MSRLLFALAVGALSLVIASAAPKGKDRPQQAIYFPTTVGAKWVYQDCDDKSESIEVVTAVEEKDGAHLVTVGYESRGEVVPERVVSVSEAGLAVIAFNVADLAEPLVLLKLPHAAGNKWEPALAGKPWGRVAGTAKADGPERVEVPAGTYQAIRVQTEMPFIDGRKGTDKRTIWYAPVVGMVKEARGDNVRVLKSFTAGKK